MGAEATTFHPSPASLMRVDDCPVCGSNVRTNLYHDLTDNAFGAVGGSWSLWRCQNCTSAYLDPRLSDAALPRAYTNYYTHGGPAASAGGLKHRLKALLYRRSRRWRNRPYGSPSRRLYAGLAARWPHLAQVTERTTRYLPAKAAGRLLDVGCGNGAYLALVRDMGWSVRGCDFDSEAVTAAAAKGLQVRVGGIESFDVAEKFDAITMNHVIEHVPDPGDTLAQAFRRLAPGGQLFIETPNIDAQGHKIFGAHWRGLEAPRHLILFNHKSLRAVLDATGFTNIRSHPTLPGARSAILEKSALMYDGRSPYEAPEGLSPAASRSMNVPPDADPDHSELLIYVAEKP